MKLTSREAILWLFIPIIWCYSEVYCHGTWRLHFAIVTSSYLEKKLLIQGLKGSLEGFQGRHMGKADMYNLTAKVSLFHKVQFHFLLLARVGVS